MFLSVSNIYRHFSYLEKMFCQNFKVQYKVETQFFLCALWCEPVLLLERVFEFGVKTLAHNRTSYTVAFDLSIR